MTALETPFQRFPERFQSFAVSAEFENADYARYSQNANHNESAFEIG